MRSCDLDIITFSTCFSSVVSALLFRYALLPTALAALLVGMSQQQTQEEKTDNKNCHPSRPGDQAGVSSERHVSSGWLNTDV